MKARGICERLKEQILGGVFDAAGRLPSSRALAQELGVSRTTVTSAYEQLAAEGFILLQRGKRPQVAPDLGGVATRRDAPAGQPAARLSAYGARLRQFTAPPVFRDARLIVDFRYGDMGRSEFPDALWKKAMVAALASQPPRLAYDDPEGNIRLRRALQGYLWRARKLTCDLDQIVVVNGSQQGLDLCARLLLDPGDSFVMENPGYPLARQVLAGTGAQALPLPVDSDGLDTERLGALSARLAYVTPSHQYPLGGVMPVPRRRQLLDWARREAAWVIEDDYDSEYRYDVNPVPPLLGLDEAERVIYLGTVSKTLSPRLRLGYLVVPVALREAFVTAKRLTDRHTAVTEQEALASLIESGAYERHVRRVRRSNGERRAALIEAVRRHLGPEAVVQGADAGLHMVLWLPGLTPIDEDALVEGCRARGVGVHPVRALYDESAPPADGAGIGLVMGYAAVDIRLIDRGIRLLAETVRRLRNGVP